MKINLSIRNVPESLASKLRARAERNLRSLQGELMVILEAAASNADAHTADAVQDTGQASSADRLLERLISIAGGRGIDTAKGLTRDQAHDRRLLRKSGV